MVRTFTLLRSIVKIMRSKGEVSKGARIYFTFDLEHFERNYRDFISERRGRLIIAGRLSLLELLTDTESLSQLPEGSVGKVFLDDVTKDGVSLVKLDAKCEPIEREILNGDENRRRFSQHVRASHDLWHVLTGYHRDSLGELLLLTFSYHQTGSPAFKWLARYAKFVVGNQVEGSSDLLAQAAKRGQRSRYLLTADWEDLLWRPLDEVRDTLGLGIPPTYTRYIRNPNGRGLVPDTLSH